MRQREKREKKSQNENNSKIFLKSNEMRNKSKNFSKWGTLGNGSQIDALKLSQSHLYIFLYYYILYIVLIKLVGQVQTFELRELAQNSAPVFTRTCMNWNKFIPTENQLHPVHEKFTGDL